MSAASTIPLSAEDDANALAAVIDLPVRVAPAVCEECGSPVLVLRCGSVHLITGRGCARDTGCAR
jgi:hypothetical protein